MNKVQSEWDSQQVELNSRLSAILLALNGGKGSGNWGHGGRPGKVGGSSSTGGGCSKLDADIIHGNKFMRDIDTSKLSAYEGEMLAKVAQGGNITPEEAMKMEHIKRCDRKLNKTEILKPEEHPDLVSRAKEEFKEKILKDADAYGGAKKDKEFAIITGLPGAGKTTAGVEELKKKGYLEVDNDIVKKVPSLAKYNKGGAGAGAIQEICGSARKLAVAELMKEGYNIIYPGTGDNLKKVTRDLNMFRDAGYKANGPEIRYVEVSNATAVTRAVVRAYADGRYTSLDYIIGMEDKPKRVVQELEKNGYLASDGNREKLTIQKSKND